MSFFRGSAYHALQGPQIMFFHMYATVHGVKVLDLPRHPVDTGSWFLPVGKNSMFWNFRPSHDFETIIAWHDHQIHHRKIDTAGRNYLHEFWGISCGIMCRWGRCKWQIFPSPRKSMPKVPSTAIKRTVVLSIHVVVIIFGDLISNETLQIWVDAAMANSFGTDLSAIGSLLSLLKTLVG